MSNPYTYRLIDPRDEAALARTAGLLNLVFPKARHLTPRYLRWQYGDNPNGGAIACNAYDGETVVGHMAALPMPALLDGEPRSGMSMVNGAIHPDHRGRKLQSRISDAMFEAAAAAGLSFVLATGNKYSTGPLLTRFKLIGPLEARIGVGTPLRRGTAALSLTRVWNDAATAWRLANPERRYAVHRQGDSTVVLAATSAPATDAVIYDGPERWPSSEQHAPSRLRLWIGRDPDIDWQRSRYISIPMRLRASPLNLVYRDLTGGGYCPDPAGVVFRVADTDFY